MKCKIWKSTEIVNVSIVEELLIETLPEMENSEMKKICDEEKSSNIDFNWPKKEVDEELVHTSKLFAGETESCEEFDSEDSTSKETIQKAAASYWRKSYKNNLLPVLQSKSKMSYASPSLSDTDEISISTISVSSNSTGKLNYTVLDNLFVEEALKDFVSRVNLIVGLMQ